MRVPNWISLGCIVIAIAIGVAIAIMLSDIATVKAGWCDARPACFRDWISALSGWAAAAGAFIAAYLTVPHLLAQAKEARRQADFLFGDAPPTLSVTPDLNDPTLLVVRLVNWNRRTVVAKQIEVSGTDDGELQFFDHKKDGKKVDHARIYVAGWEDRSGPPPTYQVRLAYEERGTLVKWPVGTEVIFTVQVIDRTHRVLQLRAAFVAVSDVAVMSDE
jgi:hypothetical protein